MLLLSVQQSVEVLSHPGRLRVEGLKLGETSRSLLDAKPNVFKHRSSCLVLLFKRQQYQEDIIFSEDATLVALPEDATTRLPLTQS